MIYAISVSVGVSNTWELRKKRRGVRSIKIEYQLLVPETED